MTVASEAYVEALGMSLAAAEAYGEGRCPASKIPGVPASLVHRFAPLTEWHITGRHERRTPFYSPAQVRALFGLEAHVDIKANADAVAALSEWKAKQPVQKFHTNCRVDWLEWGGAPHRPIAIQRIAEGCQVTVKGRTATVVFKDGMTMAKRLSTRGFSFTPGV